MAKFVQVADNMGVDDVSNWMMVPYGGSNKVCLNDGPGLQLDYPTSYLKHEEKTDVNSNVRIIRFNGLEQGNVTVRAKKGGNRSSTKIDVSIKINKLLPVVFYVVRHDLKVDPPQNKAKNIADIKKIIEGANKILEPQANTTIKMKGLVKYVDIDESTIYSYAEEVRENSIPRDNVGDLAKIAKQSPIAFAHVFFVRHLYKYQMRRVPQDTSRGLTRGKIVMLQTQHSIDKYARTLAHEVIHPMGYAGEEHLEPPSLFATAGVGKTISKKLANMINK